MAVMCLRNLAVCCFLLLLLFNGLLISGSDQLFLLEVNSRRNTTANLTLTDPEADRRLDGCVKKCFVLDWCKAYNYRLDTEQCDLFDGGMASSDQFITDTRYIYGYIEPEDVDECMESPCMNNATCYNLPNGYSCNCATGFSGEKCEQDRRCIVLIGGVKGNRAPSVEYYHPTSACNIPELSIELLQPQEMASGCFLPDAQQIVLRETDDSYYTRPPLVYHLTDGSTTALPLPYTGYTRSSTSALAGGVCLSCAGVYGNMPLAECYAYDAASASWTAMAMLPVALDETASVALGDSYYVIGGNHNGMASNQMFRYEMSTTVWHSELPLPTRRRMHAAAAISDHELLVCGGYDGGPAVTGSCHRYDAVVGAWMPAASLVEARSAFSIVRLGADLLAMGGMSAGNTYLQSVERYDRAADAWMLAGKQLNDPRLAFVALSVHV